MLRGHPVGYQPQHVQLITWASRTTSPGHAHATTGPSTCAPHSVSPAAWTSCTSAWLFLEDVCETVYKQDQDQELYITSDLPCYEHYIITQGQCGPSIIAIVIITPSPPPLSSSISSCVNKRRRQGRGEHPTPPAGIGKSYPPVFPNGFFNGLATFFPIGFFPGVAAQRHACLRPNSLVYTFKHELIKTVTSDKTLLNFE